MHLPQNEVLHLNGGSSSPSYGGVKVQDESVSKTNGFAQPVRKDSARLEPDGHDTPVTNGAPNLQLNGDYGTQTVQFTHVQADGELTSHTNGTASHSPRDNSTLSSTVLENSISIPVPDPLDFIVAGWILLIQRYQRETFHQFTWGAKDAGDDNIQNISVGDLLLQNVTTVAELLEMVNKIRAKEISIERGNGEVFLNDGSKDEVSAIVC